MELKLGKMTSQEIATWMGVSYNTYSNRISKYLEKLELFAKFRKVFGGVIIEEIYIPEYVKNFTVDDKNYYEEIKSSDNKLSTISGMTRKLKATKAEYKDIAYGTLYHRLIYAGNRTFGLTSCEDSSGRYGKRHYIWAVKVDEMNHYRLMTEEEQKEYKKLRDAYCGSAGEQIEQNEMLKDAYRNKEITAEEYATQMAEDNSFYEKVLLPLKMNTGVTLVKTTLHELFENYVEFEEEVED